MKIIKPPQSITANHRRGKMVFLAGSIDQGTSEDWQKKVATAFKALDDYTILNPRRQNWDAEWETNFAAPVFNQQVNWELNGLEKADKIFLYLAPGSQAPISLLELGLHAASGKLIVCCPEGFWRRGNVEIVCERYGIPFFSELDKMIDWCLENWQ